MPLVALIVRDEPASNEILATLKEELKPKIGGELIIFETNPALDNIGEICEKVIKIVLLKKYIKHLYASEVEVINDNKSGCSIV